MSNKHWCMPNYPLLRDTKTKSFAKEYDSDLELLRGVIFRAQDRRLHNNKFSDSTEYNRGMMTCAHCEFLLLLRKTPCFFISTPNLVRFLLESTFSENIFLDAIKSFPFTWFAFPVMNIGNISLRSCAFGCTSLGKDIDTVGRVIHEYEGDPEYTFYTGLPGPLFVSQVQGLPNIDKFISTPLAVFDRDANVSKIERGQETLDLHKRLCAAAIVYTYAFPDYIRDGLPTDVKAPALAKPRILTAAPEILEGATRTSVSMHLRAGHFKTLQHERFKRNEDGTPKIIFVRQTVVAGKLTPKTAIEP